MQSIRSLYGEVVKGLEKDAKPSVTKTPSRSRRPSSQFLRPVAVPETLVAEDKIPLLHLKRKVGTTWQYSSKLTWVQPVTFSHRSFVNCWFWCQNRFSSLYLDILKEIATSGVTFEHKNALLTGVGKGSIAVEIVKGLLVEAKVVVTTVSNCSFPYTLRVSWFTILHSMTVEIFQG